MTTVSIEYFAIFREHAGRDREQVSTSARTAGELYEELRARYAFPSVGTVRVAVNDEFRDWQTPLTDGDFVVFIPPVAGG